jgi:hypothetical protein
MLLLSKRRCFLSKKRTKCELLHALRVLLRSWFLTSTFITAFMLLSNSFRTVWISPNSSLSPGPIRRVSLTGEICRCDSSQKQCVRHCNRRQEVPLPTSLPSLSSSRDTRRLPRGLTPPTRSLRDLLERAHDLMPLQLRRAPRSHRHKGIALLAASLPPAPRHISVDQCAPEGSRGL